MAVVEMRRISLYGLQKNRKKTLEYLQRRGVVEISSSGEEDSVFHRQDFSGNEAEFEKIRQSVMTALQTLQVYAPEEKQMLSMLKGRHEVTDEEYANFLKRRPDLIKVASKVNALQKDITEATAAKLKVLSQVESLGPWMNLDIPLRLPGTDRTAAFIGTLPGETNEAELLAALDAALPDTGIHLEFISKSTDQTCFFLLVPKKAAALAEESLRSMGFARPVSTINRIPSDQVILWQDDIKAAEARIKSGAEGIRALSGHRRDLNYLMDDLAMRTEKYAVLNTVLQAKHTFYLTGYIPAPQARALEDDLAEHCGAAVELEDLQPDEEAPVLLKNNVLTAPMESIVESFSPPGKGEIDPSPVIAFFYYFFFGMMLSDAGYGLLMVLACGFVLWRFKNLEPGMEKTIRMFFYCGISTTIWGFLFGGFFGDLIPKFSATFLGHEVALTPLWFDPVKDPIRLLMFSLGVGILHLFVGVAMKGVQDWKQGNRIDVIYDVVFTYLFVGGLLLLLFTTQLFMDISKMDLHLPASAATVGAVLAGVGAVGIIATGGRDSRNPVKRLLKGLFALYNSTSGYLSDILSYSRLLALGLATGIIATVVNQMGAMFGGSIPGFIGFLVVFLLGHTLNIGINLLGAYVHTNRLQYVEFFGKFYDGGGHKFNPFRNRTNHFKFREEKDHG